MLITKTDETTRPQINQPNIKTSNKKEKIKVKKT